MTTDLRAIGFAEVRRRIEGNRLCVYIALVEHGPCTSTELAARLGWSVLSTRPRLTELCQLYHAQPTGRRRDGEHEFRACLEDEARKLHRAAKGETEVFQLTML